MSRLIALLVVLALLPLHTLADEEKAKEGPREVITAFVKELGAGEYDKAYARTTPKYQEAHPKEKWKQGFSRMAGKVDLSKLKVDRVLANEKPAKGRDARAAAVTGFVDAGEGRKLAMGFGLIRENDRWLLRDIDMLPTEDALKEFLDGFKEHEPEAKAIPAPDGEKDKAEDAPKK
jgi:hypothetical protein